MKILLFSQKLIYSGANIVAVDLASKMRDHGHEVIVYGPRGPMEERLIELGLTYFPMTPDQKLNVRWPSLRVARELRKLAVSEGIDLVHTYEWPACLEATLGPYWRDGVPLVASVMSMRVEKFMPRTLPIIVGTRSLRDDLMRSKYRSVTFIPPSVDVIADAPGLDNSDFRKEVGISDQSMMVVIVSRLSRMKIASMFQAMDVVANLSKTIDLKLVIVGGGALEDHVYKKAAALNSDIGNEVVFLTGPLGDPRPAYESADVVIGMGSSAMRGLAFAKPVIVVGDNGFVELFTPETSGEFLVQGFWGYGDGDSRGTEELTSQLERLFSDVSQREALGAFGRKFVCERFSLEKQAEILADVYKQALSNPHQLSDRRSEVMTSMLRLLFGRGKAWVTRRGRRLPKVHD